MKAPNKHSLKKKPLLIIISEKLIPNQFYEQGYHLDGILLSLCVKGSINVQANSQKVVMQADDLFVLLPQSIVNTKDCHENSSFLCLLFSFDEISELILPTDYNFLKTLLQTPVLTLSESEKEMYFRYFELLKANYDNAYSVFHDSILKYLLFSLIGQINICYKQQEDTLKLASRKEKIVFQFFNLVHQYYVSERSVQYYADQLKLTPKYLTTLIRERTGRSISIIITELVIIKAKSYLSATDLSVSEITELLYFSDSSMFCRYFKKYTGISPLMYRK
ncbi:MULTISPECIES: AraC family transcriptional regulator [unclassified Sphingobacterium]|uniref:helix-turn-helix domain-containing protein n=1 Tax=unclassified Sphingobacterium TaxID=2609468 RepID=UPI00104FF00F|nr:MULTISPECIES: helix-turn-helix transcriptional regulator [unclassified Sphingobacterium]MCS3554723.1 AraC-like DNA-binding protein [Sphingobacterium sp. JUb21]TCR07711.1 helix-turn-helix protein [Sphingobacterium sp. JUb20]